MDAVSIQCPNCDVPTKQEKLTGATYQVKVYSEQEVTLITLTKFYYYLVIIKYNIKFISICNHISTHSAGGSIYIKLLRKYFNETM